MRVACISASQIPSTTANSIQVMKNLLLRNYLFTMVLNLSFPSNGYLLERLFTAMIFHFRLFEKHAV
jgi:hypothetical protein